MNPYDSAPAPPWRHPENPEPQLAFPYALNDRYVLTRKIGSGGFGVVYEAEDRVFPNPGGGFKAVAIKLLYHHKMVPWALDRVRQAETLVGLLQHPNIASAFDAGDVVIRHENTSWDATYLTMELLLEKSTILTATKGLTLDERVDVLIKVARGLEAAQKAGLRHLDIKPSNIMLSVADRTPKIVDFGLSGWGDPAVALGHTIEYASPEQVLGNPVGFRSDVFSLAVVAYEALSDATNFPYDTQDHRFVALSQEDKINLITRGAVHPLGTYRSRRTPRRLELVLLKALRTDPDERYSGAGAFLRDLVRYRSGQMTTAEPRSPARRAMNWLARNRTLAVGAAVVVISSLLIGAAGIAAAWQYRVNEQLSRAAELDAIEKASLSREKEAMAVARKQSVLRSANFLGDVISRMDTYETNDQPLDFSYILRSAEAELKTVREEPLARATIYSVLGRVAANRKEFMPAITWLREATALWPALAQTATDPQEARDYQRRQARALNHLAWALNESGNPTAACEPANQAYVLQDQIDGPNDENTIALHFDWAKCLLDADDPRGFPEFVAALASVTRQTSDAFLVDATRTAREVIAVAKEGNRADAIVHLHLYLKPFEDPARPRIRARLPWSLSQAGTFLAKGKNMPAVPFLPKPEDMKILGGLMNELGYELAKDQKPRGSPDLNKTKSELEQSGH